jgi:hypothetical protein
MWSHAVKEYRRLMLPWRLTGPKREEGAEGGRKLHNKQLYSLHPLPGIVMMMKLMMGWTRYVAHVRAVRNAQSTTLWSANGKGRENLGD